MGLGSEAQLWGVGTGLDPGAQSSAPDLPPELPTPEGFVCL